MSEVNWERRGLGRADVPALCHHAVAFGELWHSDLPLHAFEPAVADETGPGIAVRLFDDAPPSRLVVENHQRMHHVRDGFRYVSEEMVADTYGRDRIDLRPGPAWTGSLPPAFFGTVVAALMTWRGGIAIHGSAVALGGKAMLFCGPSGAGKSTLTAAALAAGGRLLSDDLTVLHPQLGGKAPLLFAGRRGLRLFPDVADMLGAAVPLDGPILLTDHKAVVAPPRLDPQQAIPLGGIVLLGGAAPGGAAVRIDLPVPELAHLLRQQLFRRRGFRHIPGFPLRLAHLGAIARAVPMSAHGGVEARDNGSFRRLVRTIPLLFEQAVSAFQHDRDGNPISG